MREFTPDLNGLLKMCNPLGDKQFVWFVARNIYAPDSRPSHYFAPPFSMSFSTSRRTSASARSLFTLSLSLPAVLSAQSVWDGGAAPVPVWSDALNWTDDLAPLSDNATRLVFTGSANLGPQADSPFSLLSLAFDASASAFSVSGGTLSFAGSATDDPAVSFLRNDSAVLQTIINDLELGDFTHLIAAGGDLRLDGVVNLGAAGATATAAPGRVLTVSTGFAGSAPLTLNGGGLVVWAGSGNGFFGLTRVQADTTLHLTGSVYLEADLIVSPGATVEVAGGLSNAPSDSVGSVFTDATVHVLSGGYLDGNVDFNDDATDGFHFQGDSVLVLESADAIGPDAYLTFSDNATVSSTTPGAIADGWFVYRGTDPLSADPERTLALPGPGVIIGGRHEFEGKIAAAFDQPGMITGPTEIGLYDTARLTLGASGALDGTALTPGGFEGVYLHLNQSSSITLGAADALTHVSLVLNDASRLVLSGHDVTVDNLAAFDASQIVNNSPTPATFRLTPAGFGPSIVNGDVFADADPDLYSGPTGSLSLDFDGVGDVLLFGIQRHTGSTTVTGIELAVYGREDTDFVIRGLVSSNLLLNTGGVLAGAGPVNSVAAGDGSGLSPGSFYLNPIDRLATGEVTLSGNVFMNLDLLDATGGAGIGWDVLAVDGTFTFSALPGDSFSINLRSGDQGLTDTVAHNFDTAVSYSFSLIQTTGGIIGYAPGRVTLNTSGFINRFDGEWSVRLSPDGNDLIVDYTAIPEPAAFAALLGIGVLGVVGTRRRGRVVC